MPMCHLSRGTPYHLSGWRVGDRKGVRASIVLPDRLTGPVECLDARQEDIAGVLPLIHLKHLLFGKFPYHCLL
jgi:hypothetical protein